MRVLSTQLHLKKDVSYDQIIEVVLNWIESSHYYKELAPGLKNYKGEKSYRFDGTYSYLKILKSDGSDGYCAVHVLHNYYDQQWITDVIYRKGYHDVTVHIDCVSQANLKLTPPEQRTDILQSLIDSTYLENGILPMTSEPIYADGLLDYMVDVITGNVQPDSTIIYVSRIRGSLGYEVNIDRLAKKLKGIAYVVAEPNEDFSNTIRERTAGKNVWNGYIAIYAANMPARHIKVDGNATKIEQDIVKSVCEINTSQVDAQAPNWNDLNLLEIESEAREKGELLKVYDEENISLEDKIKRLQDKVARLTQENTKLMVQCAEYKEALNGESSLRSIQGLLASGKMEEFFDYEKYDLVVTTIRDRIEKLDPSSRPYELLKSILISNPIKGVGLEILNKLKSIMGNGALNDRDLSALQEIGFEIKRGAGHMKLIYNGNPKYSYTMSISPSDVRCGKNLYSIIEKQLSVYKMR